MKDTEISLKILRLELRLKKLINEFNTLSRQIKKADVAMAVEVGEKKGEILEERKKEERSAPPEPLSEERKKLKKEEDETAEKISELRDETAAQGAELTLFDDLEERKEAFRQAVMAWRGQYSEGRLRRFVEYYTRMSDVNNRRMRFELGRFDIGQRLSDWRDYGAVRDYIARKAEQEERAKERAQERERERRQREAEREREREENRREVVPLGVLRAFVAEGLGNAFAMRADNIQDAILAAETQGKSLSPTLADWAHTRER